MAPVGFVSDHMEVVYDLDIEARERAAALGLGFVRAGTAGTHPAFVRMIRELVEERVSGGARRALGSPGTAPRRLRGRLLPVGRRPAAGDGARALARLALDLTGSVYVLDRQRVHPLSATMAQTIQAVSRWGSGTRDLVAAMSADPRR